MGQGTDSIAIPVRLYRVFIASAILALGITAVLVSTPLWSVETRCGPIIAPQDDSACGPAQSTRLHWVVAGAVLVVGFGIAGVYANRLRSSLPRTPLRWFSLVLLVFAILAAVCATLFLALGSNNSACGSTLSRVTYDADGCVAGWASGRHRAWIAGSVSAAALLVATALELAASRSEVSSLRRRTPALG